MKNILFPEQSGGQSGLFMAVNEEPVKLPEMKELDDYRLLFRIIQGDRRFGWLKAIETRVPLFLVAYEVSSEPQQIIANLSDWIEWLYRQNKKRRLIVSKVLKTVAINHPDLFELLLLHGQQVKAKWQPNGEIISSEIVRYCLCVIPV